LLVSQFFRNFADKFNDYMRRYQEEFGKLWELNPIWNLLTPEQKAFIDNNSEIKKYRKNEMIHREGDMPTHIMMVVSGTVRLSKEGVGQRVQIIRLLKPFDLFGYRSAIVGDAHSSCASTLEGTVVYRVRREAFLKVVQHNNEFCFGVLVAMSKDLAISESRTVNLTQKHIRGRLAESLITLRQTYGLDEDGATIAMYMAREDLANMSNMTTSNAIRTLSQFASEGLVAIDGRKIKILDEDELMRISRLG
jgi:CRP-like cAMP-binding protein